MILEEMLPELSKRWINLQKEMQLNNADACLISINVNLFYLTDSILSGYFYLPAEGEPFIFVRRPAGITGKQVFYIRKPEQITEILLQHGLSLPRQLMLELDELPYNDVIRLQSIFQPNKLLNCTAAIRKLRSVKSEYEIGLLRASGKIHASCYAEIPSLYKTGMTDLDFSIEIERLFRRKGATGQFRVFGQSMELFMGSVITGENADNPSPYDFAMGGSGVHKSMPIGPNGTVITEGHAIMVDMGGTFTGYISDMTRIYSKGKVNKLAQKAHNVSIEILRELERACKTGVAVADLYHLALGIVKKNELEQYFMGYSQQAGFVGHGIGIQINESPVFAPRSRDILQAGHVFALEPKFVIPGTGAVGAENSYALHESGIENLTVLEEEIVKL
jgi:Xaa-Pro aminopeptidase